MKSHPSSSCLSLPVFDGETDYPWAAYSKIKVFQHKVFSIEYSDKKPDFIDYERSSCMNSSGHP